MNTSKLSRWLLVFSWVLATHTLHAEKPSPYLLQMRQAAGFYDIGAYAQAIAIYQELLSEPLSPWQKAALIYDMGNVQLADGNWDQAITNFKGVPVDEAPSPLLLYRTKTNLALSYWQKAHALSHVNTGEAYDQIIELLKTSLKEVDLAIEVHCSLEKMEGSAACLPVPDLQHMRSAILGQMALTSLQKSEDSIARPSLEKGLPLLLEGLNDVRAQLNFIQKHTLQGDLKQRYVDFFAHSAQGWLPLWFALKQRVQEIKEQDMTALYSNAEKRYKQGIQRLEQQEFEASSAAFDTAAAAIESLIQKLQPKTAPPTGSTGPEMPSSPLKESQPSVETGIPEKGGSAMDQVLRLLIEMQKEDASLTPTPSTANKKELRPW